METQPVSSMGWFSASLLISRGKPMALNISLNWKPLFKGIRIAFRENMYGTPPPPPPPRIVIVKSFGYHNHNHSCFTCTYLNFKGIISLKSVSHLQLQYFMVFLFVLNLSIMFSDVSCD